MNKVIIGLARRMMGYNNPINPIGREEGEICNWEQCDGILKYPPVENCSCHINPPCHNCVDNKLECDKCYRIVEE